METKVCKKCGDILTIDKFGIDKSKKDNISIYCKECNRKNYEKKIPKSKEEMIERRKQYNKQYSKQNVEQMKLWVKKYAEKNKILIAERKRKYYEDNLEILKSQNKIWRGDNRDKCNIIGISRRTKKRNLLSNLTSEQWINIRSYFNEECSYCGKKLPLAQEHFIPLTKGGEFTLNNIIPSCKSCNSSKTTKDFFEWYPTYKFYSKKREKNILKFLGIDDDIQQLKII